MNLVFFGPYGSGKGTQAKILADKYHLTTFSTGEAMRKHIREKTILGEKIITYTNSGQLVPDEIIMDVVKDFLNQLSNNFILDGIPRTMNQANLFDQMLKEKGINVYKILIDIPENISIIRQTTRKTCGTCEKIFTGDYDKETCDRCNNLIVSRPENDPEIAKKRAAVYKNETLPIIEMYKEKGEMIEIDGMLPMNEVTQEIIKYLQ